MRVLQVNSVCGIRSTGRICIDIADVLTEQGHECKIAYGREIVPDKYHKYAVRIGTNLDVNIHGLKSRIFDSSGFHSKSETKKFTDWVKVYDPDIIHLHNLHGYYINIEILFDYLAKADKPVIWTLHDCWAFTGHCAHFTVVKCDKWKTGCFDCPQKKRYPSSYVFDRSKQNWLKKKELFTQVSNMTFVTPSQWLANLVEESFLRDYKVKVIPNGIDLEAFKPTKSDFRKRYNLINKKVILGVASAWSQSKGFDDFIKLSTTLDDGYRIVLVGLGEKQLKLLPNNVIGISRTNNIKELVEIYTAADVFLNPSRQETMGLTTVEAMACGTPVLVSNLTAVPEVVDEDGGLILESLDTNYIAKTIEKINKEEYTNTRNNALRYEKQDQYLKYIDLYNKSL